MTLTRLRTILNVVSAAGLYYASFLLRNDDGACNLLIVLATWNVTALFPIIWGGGN